MYKAGKSSCSYYDRIQCICFGCPLTFCQCLFRRARSLQFAAADRKHKEGESPQSPLSAPPTDAKASIAEKVVGEVVQVATRDPLHDIQERSICIVNNFDVSVRLANTPRSLCFDSGCASAVVESRERCGLSVKCVAN